MQKAKYKKINRRKKEQKHKKTLFFCLAVSLFMENVFYLPITSLQTNLTSSYWCAEMLS